MIGKFWDEAGRGIAFVANGNIILGTKIFFKSVNQLFKDYKEYVNERKSV